MFDWWVDYLILDFFIEYMCKFEYVLGVYVVLFGLVFVIGG